MGSERCIRDRIIIIISTFVFIGAAIAQLPVEGLANGKCKTLRDGETRVFLCEGFECETLSLAKNRDSETPSNKRKARL